MRAARWLTRSWFKSRAHTEWLTPAIREALDPALRKPMTPPHMTIIPYGIVRQKSCMISNKEKSTKNTKCKKTGGGFFVNTVNEIT